MSQWTMAIGWWNDVALVVFVLEGKENDSEEASKGVFMVGVRGREL